MASIKGHLKTVEYLVALGADNDYALQMASENGHFKMVEYLVSDGADIRSDDDYAVQRASENGHHEVAKYLVSRGADGSKITQESRRYLSFCQRMEDQKKHRAQKKIFFWWIPKCYNPKTDIGKRMAEKGWQSFDQVQKRMRIIKS